jgi:hypothetical protein
MPVTIFCHPKLLFKRPTQQAHVSRVEVLTKNSQNQQHKQELKKGASKMQMTIKTINRSSKSRLSTLLIRTAALSAFAAAATLGLKAQQPVTTAAPAQPALNLQASLMAPLELTSSSSSSSSSSTDAAPATEHFDFNSEATQPPPRRRYRRPNYSDSHTNTDGSSRYTFAVGGGLTLPTGNTHQYLTPSYNFQVGAGRNFNKTFGVLAQFDWANFGFQGKTLANQLAIYQALGATDGYGNPITTLDGSSHVWSLSINPIVNYYTSDTWGSYVIGGIGFYHKTANFTVPAPGYYCDYYGFCYQYSANATIDHYTSNAVGFNGGIGFTRKFSRFGSGKIYAEARYVWIDNQPRAFGGYNLYSPNSNRTSYVPITVGFRW